MLAVRNRFIDVTLLTGAAVALIVLATTIPDMPVYVRIADYLSAWCGTVES